VVALVGLAAAAWQGAAGATITFDFNALTGGRGNGEVESYMKGVLAGAGFGADGVTVTGAKASKVDKGSNADGEANAFILGSAAGTIVVTFDSPVHGVSFDYELFPEVQCANGSNAHNCEPSGFSFLADGVVRFATASSTGDTVSGPPGQMKKLGDASGFASPRGASGWLDLPGGVTRLEFRNTSGSAGIDNLQVAAAAPAAFSIAEPATLVLLGMGLAGIGYARRRTAWHPTHNAARPE
jgi:hypothetical protein